MTIVEQIAAIKLENVMKVYSGRDGKCCCGCAGTYRVASQHADAAGKDRGYTVTSDEISDRQVKRVLGIIQKNSSDASAEIFSEYAAVVVGARLYIVYFAEKI